MSKNILVTGGSGFIGSHVVDSLIKKNYKVTIFDLTKPRRKDVKFIKGNLLNYNLVSKAVKKNSIVFHLAAYNHVGDSFKHGLENVNSNLISTMNLLDHGPKFKKFIHMGTSEIYGIQKKLPFNIKEKPNPMSPYGVTKYASEHKNFELNYNLTLK